MKLTRRSVIGVIVGLLAPKPKIVGALPTPVSPVATAIAPVVNMELLAERLGYRAALRVDTIVLSVFNSELPPIKWPHFTDAEIDKQISELKAYKPLDKPAWIPSGHGG